MNKKEIKDMKKYYFNIIKKLINDENDTKILIDNQFYYNKKAFDYVNKFDKRFFLNSYYNLTSLDLLLMIDEAENIEEIEKNLMEEYSKGYAKAIYQNFISILENN